MPATFSEAHVELLPHIGVAQVAGDHVVVVIGGAAIDAAAHEQAQRVVGKRSALPVWIACMTNANTSVLWPVDFGHNQCMTETN